MYADESFFMFYEYLVPMKTPGKNDRTGRDRMKSVGVGMGFYACNVFSVYERLFITFL